MLHGVGDGLRPTGNLTMLALSDIEKGLFRLAENQVSGLVALKTVAFGFAGAINNRPQQMLLPHNINVIFGVRGGGGHVHQRFQKSRTTQSLQPVRGPQTLDRGQQVDRHAGFLHGRKFIEQATMGLEVKGFGDDPFPNAKVHYPGSIQEDGP